MKWCNVATSNTGVGRLICFDRGGAGDDLTRA